jgi:nitrate/nitrite-specific signal transduction histidine kinase
MIRNSTIRTRLLISFVLIALLPALGISIGSAVVGYRSGRQAASDQLVAVAARKQSEIDNLMQTVHTELIGVLNEPYAFDWMQAVLSRSYDGQSYDTTRAAIRTRFQNLLQQSFLFTEVMLLDYRGRAIVSTDRAGESQDYSNHVFFRRELDASREDVAFCYLTSNTIFIVSSAPFDRDGWFSGMLVGRVDNAALHRILVERTGLGESGESYLLSDNGDIWAEQSTGGLVSLPAGIVVDGEPAINESVKGTRVLVTTRWLPDLQRTLVVQQKLSEAYRSVYTSLGVSLGIALIAVLIAAGASVRVTRSIADPLGDLAETASQIAAGDLEQEAQEGRRDEVGALATAFNSMTAQLRDLIGNLELRVRERTRELEISAQVSREVTSILDMDRLLPQVVEMIRDAFDYYHVHLFLIQEETGALWLRASSAFSSAERFLLNLSDKGLNSRVVQRNEAVLINDIRQEPDLLGDERLPKARAELVVPLRVGVRVIGTLDVQNAEINAFSTTDLLVIQSLGDQIAIAIENARHYRQAQQLATMAERQRLARELHDSLIQSLYSLTLLTEGGRRLAESGRLEDVSAYFADLWQIAHQSLKEMRLLIYEMRPVALDQADLITAIQQRLDAVEGRAGVQARLLVEGEIFLPPHEEEALYRIAQEALNNSLKHAAATEITVHLEAQVDRVSLRIQDNGRGFDIVEAEGSGGLGLYSMRERAKAMEGELSVYSEPGKGTELRVTLEVEDEGGR